MGASGPIFWVASCVEDIDHGLSYLMEGCIDSTDDKVIPVGSCSGKGGEYKCCHKYGTGLILTGVIKGYPSRSEELELSALKPV